ncbi:MAG: BLUF domain-containing protein [Erythrobacter sp.]
MLSLIYVSTASTRVDDAMVRQIAGTAAQRNAKAEVTGLLAYNSRSFMQLLEGDGDAVLEIMQGIERDVRHDNIVYVRRDMRDRRECPNWSMRSLITPLTGIGSAKVFTGLLPSEMEFDTKILFTSFASSLSGSGVAQLIEEEQEFRDRRSRKVAREHD